jgi:hypothetical protein
MMPLGCPDAFVRDLQPFFGEDDEGFKSRTGVVCDEAEPAIVGAAGAPPVRFPLLRV